MLASQLQIGESLANNGVCLTVVATKPGAVEFDLLAETAVRTNLSELRVGSLINLERSMLAASRFDGHIVQGHVDATAVIVSIGGLGQDHRIEIALPDAFQRYIVFKGSVAVNGISLTVAEVRERFDVWRGEVVAVEPVEVCAAGGAAQHRAWLAWPVIA